MTFLPAPNAGYVVVVPGPVTNESWPIWVIAVAQLSQRRGIGSALVCAVAAAYVAGATEMSAQVGSETAVARLLLRVCDDAPSTSHEPTEEQIRSSRPVTMVRPPLY